MRTHHRTSFDSDQCNIRMNCRGYFAYELMSKTFDMDPWFEIGGNSDDADAVLELAAA